MFLSKLGGGALPMMQVRVGPSWRGQLHDQLTGFAGKRRWLYSGEALAGSYFWSVSRQSQLQSLS